MNNKSKKDNRRDGQHTHVEIHIIQSMPTSRCNTDRQGHPKTIVFGGLKRWRFSSQSNKYATRSYAHQYKLLGLSEQGFRSFLVPQKIAEQLQEQKILQDQAIALTEKALAIIDIKVKEDSKTDYPIFFAEELIVDLAKIILTHQAELNALEITADMDKAAKKKLIPPALRQQLVAVFQAHHNPEEALYGRYLAALPEGCVDACVQIMHSQSVHASYDELDFITVRDDFLEPHLTGAGYIADVGIGAPTMYHYGAINLSELETKLGSKKAMKLTAAAFIEAFVKSFPQGAKNATAAATFPQYVLLQQVEDGEPHNAVSAFEVPVIARGRKAMSTTAAEILEAVIKLESEMYDLKERKRVRLSLVKFEDQQFAEQASSLKAAITKILEA